MPNPSLKFSFSYKPRSSTEPGRAPLSSRMKSLSSTHSIKEVSSVLQDGDQGKEQEEEEASSQIKYSNRFQLASLLQIFLGLLVMVLNIIFIYFGLKAKWYTSFLGQDSSLNVISVGEGIIAGLFYVIIALLSLYLRNREKYKKTLLSLYFLLITISTSLTLANACQIGLVQMFSPRQWQHKDSMARQVEMSLAEVDRISQIVILVFEMSANYSVLVISVLTAFAHCSSQ